MRPPPPFFQDTKKFKIWDTFQDNLQLSAPVSSSSSSSQQYALHNIGISVAFITVTGKVRTSQCNESPLYHNTAPPLLTAKVLLQLHTLTCWP